MKDEDSATPKQRAKEAEILETTEDSQLKLAIFSSGSAVVHIYLHAGRPTEETKIMQRIKAKWVDAVE